MHREKLAVGYEPIDQSSDELTPLVSIEELFETHPVIEAIFTDSQFTVEHPDYPDELFVSRLVIQHLILPRSGEPPVVTRVRAALNTYISSWKEMCDDAEGPRRFEGYPHQLFFTMAEAETFLPFMASYTQNRPYGLSTESVEDFLMRTGYTKPLFNDDEWQGTKPALRDHDKEKKNIALAQEWFTIIQEQREDPDVQKGIQNALASGNYYKVYEASTLPDSYPPYEVLEPLFRRYKNGLKAQSRLRNDYTLSPTKYNRLRFIADAGDTARDIIVYANMRLVANISKRYKNQSSMEHTDLMQEGVTGLLKAMQRFQPVRGHQFTTYATLWIRQAVTRSMANDGDIIRRPVHLHGHEIKYNEYRATTESTLGRLPTVQEVATKLGVTEATAKILIKGPQEPLSLDTPVTDDTDATLHSWLEDTETPSPEDSAIHSDRREQVRRILEENPRLDDREKLILSLRFGIGDAREPMTLEEIGRELGVTRERIRQLQEKALTKLSANGKLYSLYNGLPNENIIYRRRKKT